MIRVIRNRIRRIRREKFLDKKKKHTKYGSINLEKIKFIKKNRLVKRTI